MVIKDLLEAYREDINQAIFLLSKLLQVDKSYIYTHLDQDLSQELVASFKSKMLDIKMGIPIQYVVGERNFMGLDFYVDKRVLIPRNDTEILVEHLLDFTKANEDFNHILELGLGSGAISLSLAYYNKNLRLTAVDISRGALEVASINKKRLGVKNLKILEGDLFSPLGPEDTFNIIVSNPPYIAKKDLAGLDPSVRDQEPSLALDGGEDGLDFYREITKTSRDYLERGGLLIYEIGYDQRQALEVILKENGFSDIFSLKDYGNRDRVIGGFYK